MATTDQLEALSRIYRHTRRAAPSADTDALILRAARRQVEKPAPPNPFPGGWKVPASLAAVLVIGLSLTLQIREHPQSETGELPPAAEPLGGNEQMESADAPQPAPDSDATLGEQAVAGEAETGGGRAAAKEQAPAGAVVTPQPARPSVQQRAIPKLPQEQSAGSAMESVESQSAAALSPPEWLNQPLEWLARIEALVRDGELDAARAQLTAFRQAYPQHPVAGELRDALAQ